MLKRDEQLVASSCWNKAASDEPVFVIRGKDPVAIRTIQHWMRLRLRTGLNSADDAKIKGVSDFLNIVEQWRLDNDYDEEPPLLEPNQSPEEAVVTLLDFIGEDPGREGLAETPARVVKAYKEFFCGYNQDPRAILKTFEDGACDEMVILTGVELYSHCEHHMVPFIGTAHIAYIPDKRIVGISKLARLLEVYARRLQVQERLTTQITAALDEHLKPRGSACVIEAKHFCMCSRGVNKQNSKLITSSMTGVFRESNSLARAEFMGLIR